MKSNNVKLQWTHIELILLRYLVWTTKKKMDSSLKQC